MNPKITRILRRFGKAVAAGAIAVAIAHLPELGPILPRPEITLPVFTAGLLALEKALQKP